MILFPDVQEKARSHVEAVCGDRLPEMADYDNLGYIRAVMKETIRWLLKMTTIWYVSPML
jgi:cytochrome P450